ncbi:hypothetical protein F441_22562, partial [Phytophthora nicotianae CJ01A1]
AAQRRSSNRLEIIVAADDDYRNNTTLAADTLENTKTNTRDELGSISKTFLHRFAARPSRAYYWDGRTRK